MNIKRLTAVVMAMTLVVSGTAIASATELEQEQSTTELVEQNADQSLEPRHSHTKTVALKTYMDFAFDDPNWFGWDDVVIVKFIDGDMPNVYGCLKYYDDDYNEWIIVDEGHMGKGDVLSGEIPGGATIGFWAKSTSKAGEATFKYTMAS